MSVLADPDLLHADDHQLSEAPGDKAAVARRRASAEAEEDVSPGDVEVAVDDRDVGSRGDPAGVELVAHWRAMAAQIPLGTWIAPLDRDLCPVHRCGGVCLVHPHVPAPQPALQRLLLRSRREGPVCAAQDVVQGRRAIAADVHLVVAGPVPAAVPSADQGDAADVLRQAVSSAQVDPQPVGRVVLRVYDAAEVVVVGVGAREVRRVRGGGGASAVATPVHAPAVLEVLQGASDAVTACRTQHRQGRAIAVCRLLAGWQRDVV
eukprot:767030-Hanusia_phi.AAC.2